MKKRFRRIACILLCAVCVLQLAACGGKSPEGEATLGRLNVGYTCCGDKHKVPDGDLILVQVNALAYFALRENVMPNLFEFAKNAYSHQSFYAQRGDSEGIYSALTSLYAPLSSIDTEASYYTLAHLLKDNGYTLNAYCAAKDSLLATAMGFEAPITDKTASDALADAAKLAENGKKDFSFVVMDAIAYPYVADGESNAVIEGDGPLNSYFNCAGYADKVLEGFLNSVSEDATVVIYGTAPRLDEKFGIYGKEHSDIFENGFSYDQAFKAPLIMRGAKERRVTEMQTFATVYDLYPTLASYLGAKSDKMLVSGENVLCGKQGEGERFFALQGDYKRGHFITNSVYYLKPQKIASVYKKDTMEQLFDEGYKSYERTVLETINECEQAVEQGYFAGKVDYKQLYTAMQPVDSLALVREDISGGGSLASYKAFLSATARTYSAGALTGIWNGTCFKDGVITLEEGVDSGSFVTEVLPQAQFDKLYITPASSKGGKLELYASYENDKGIFTEWASVFSYASAGTDGEGAISARGGAEKVRLKLVLTAENGVAPTLSAVTLSPVSASAAEGDEPIIDEPVLEAIEVFAPDSFATKTFSGVLAIEALVSKALGREPNLENVIAVCCNSKTATICTTSPAALAYYAASNGITAYVDVYGLSDLVSTLSAPQQVVVKTENGFILAIGYDEENIIAILPENGEQIKIPFKEFSKQTEVVVVDSNLYTPEIIESIVPENSCIRPGEVVEKKKYIVIHNTGNYSSSATAKAHSNYLHSQTDQPDRQASWHYTVDDKEIYHHIPDNENAWHASDGSYGEGNYYGIGIEVCVNNFPNTYEGEEYEAFLQQFMRATKNTAYLVAKLMIENDIGMDGIKQHYDFAPDKKNCPMQMRYTSATGSFTRDEGDMWIYLLGEVEKQYNSMKEAK